MPINSCSDNGQPGYKWGDSGKCYIYSPENPSSRVNARKKALAQGIAIGDIDIKGLEKEMAISNVVQALTMQSGIKNPQQGYPKRQKKKTSMTKADVDFILKSLTQWFREEWVDISRPKPGGGFEPCGRADASEGKYPKCVPASRAAKMTDEEIRSAVNRKRRAESTQRRTDKKPIYVSTKKAETKNIPTNPSLYARVKAEAKRMFDVYPSAYANAWLVREYKKRGGGYRTVTKTEFLLKVSEDITVEEAALSDAVLSVAKKYGPFDREGSGIWVGYESEEENDDKEIGVHCKNCTLYLGANKCAILSHEVEEYAKCRFAMIPDSYIMETYEEDESDDEDMEDENASGNGEMEDESEDSVEIEKEQIEFLISLIRDLLNNKESENEV